MIIFSLVNTRLIPGPPGSIFWVVNYFFNCDNIVVNPLLYLKVSFVVDPMDSVESFFRGVLDILFLSPFS